MSVKRPRVVIVFLNYNGMEIKFKGKSILKQSLDSLARTTYKGYKLIAIDNGSTDESKAFLKESGIETINIRRNVYNFSRINNIGVRYAIRKYNPEYIVLYSNDVFVKDPNWLTKIMEAADTVKDAGIVTCKILNPDGTIQSLGTLFVDGEGIGIKRREEKRIHGYIDADIMPGCAFMIRRRLISKIGLLDENFVMGYEDFDYSLMTKEAGFKVIIADKASLIHLSNFTNASLWKTSVKAQKIMAYKNMRNYLYFFDKHKNMLTGKQRLRRLLIRFPVVFFGASFTKTMPMSERRMLGIKKYGSLWNMYATFRAIMDHNAEKALNRGKPIAYYKKIIW